MPARGAPGGMGAAPDCTPSASSMMIINNVLTSFRRSSTSPCKLAISFACHSTFFTRCHGSYPILRNLFLGKHILRNRSIKETILFKFPKPSFQTFCGKSKTVSTNQTGNDIRLCSRRIDALQFSQPDQFGFLQSLKLGFRHRLRFLTGSVSLNPNSRILF